VTKRRLAARAAELEHVVSGFALLIEEYDERSADTEDAERYPWGVAADDLRAILGATFGKESTR
jgi:hypothetical protein